MNRIAFYGGFIILLVGLVVWILRPNQSAGKSEISLFGAKFTFDTPAFAVMVIGLALMLFSTRFPDAFGPSPEQSKKSYAQGKRSKIAQGPTTFSICADILAQINRSRTIFVGVAIQATSELIRPTEVGVATH
jgi:hypothetical protein